MKTMDENLNENNDDFQILGFNRVTEIFETEQIKVFGVEHPNEFYTSWRLEASDEPERIFVVIIDVLKPIFIPCEVNFCTILVEKLFLNSCDCNNFGSRCKLTSEKVLPHSYRNMLVAIVPY